MSRLAAPLALRGWTCLSYLCVAPARAESCAGRGTVGHIRLGQLPKTKQWRTVFDALDAPDVNGASIASATAHAAGERFEALKSDPTLQHTVWLLARLGAAAKSDDFVTQLDALGIDARRAASGIGLVAEVGRVVRSQAPPTSALAELALKAAQRVLSERVVEQSKSLFGTTIDDVRAASASFGTKEGFAALSKDFFGDFAARTVRFLAEKELSNHVGPRDALRTLEDASAVTRDIERYCRESAEIVRDFAAGWYSKANWQTENEIDRDRAEGFLAYALEKLRSEVERGGRR